MKNPLVSVVIPNYNNEQYISKCLDSVLAQTYKNLEVLVVDDSSTDSSADIINEYIDLDSRVRLIINTENIKVSRNRHQGILRSYGSFVTTLDSDDYYFNEYKIQNEIELLSTYGFPEDLIAYSQTWILNTKNKSKPQFKHKNALEGNLFNAVLVRDAPIPRDFIFSRALYLTSGGFDFDIQIFEDWDLKIRLSALASWKYTNKPGVVYRLHDSGLSSVDQGNLDYWKNFVFEKNIADLPHKAELKKRFLSNSKSRIQKSFKRMIKSTLLRN